jgi:ribonuclease BN (tRNA processing enzyme)
MMKLTILGASPAVPNPGEACSGYLLQTDRSTLLIDCGHGVTSILQTVVDLSDISAIIISHMHPDHFFDLIPLKYGYLFQGFSGVPLFLPPEGKGVLQRLQSAIGLNKRFFEESFTLHEYDAGDALRDIPGFSVSFAPTQHFVAGYALRVSETDDSDRQFFYSSDTGWVDTVLDLSRGASLALLEATLLKPEDIDEPPGHLTAAEAGELARTTGVEQLVLTHYPRGLADAIRREASGTFGREVHLAEERQVYTV